MLGLVSENAGCSRGARALDVRLDVYRPRHARGGLARVIPPLRLSEVHVDRKTALEGRGLRAAPKDAPKQAGFRLRSCEFPIGGATGFRDRTCVGADHVKRSNFV
jgi:hypothetical protein